MSGRFVRASKFRHVFGTASRKEQCYENVTITRSSLEGKFCAANSKFLAVCIYAGGGGSFLVIPHDRYGRQDINAPKVAGHSNDVLDLEWNPFNDNMIASSDEDGAIKIWEIPDGGLTTNLNSPLLTVNHQKKVSQLSWHPVAANILLSVSYEPCVAVWNLETGEQITDVEHPDQVYNAEWNEIGSKIVSACKDKIFRIINPRTGDIIQKFKGHVGGKPQRVIFLTDDKLFSTGFTKMSSREYAVWDLKNTSEALFEDQLDSANGTLIPYYDRDIKILYVAGRGDSTIRYYEITDEEPYVHWITNFQSKLPHRGICMSSKRSVDVNRNEVALFYRLLSDKHMVEPVSFTVPRKGDTFHKDIYPDTPGDEPALTADEWCQGKDAEPKRVSMQDFFLSKDKKKATGLGSKVGSKTGLKPAAVSAAPAASATSASAPVATAADSAEVVHLQNEIKGLKDNEKKLKDEITSLRSEVSELRKLKDEFAAIKGAVKRNAERVDALESMVQEVSDDEAK